MMREHREEISDEHVGMVAAIAETAGLKVVPPDTWRARLLRGGLIFFALVIVACSLALTTITLVTKDRNEGRFVREIAKLNAKINASDALDRDRLVCGRRFQDLVDEAGTELTIDIGELVVIITQVPRGDEREAAVLSKIADLQASNLKARKAVNDKAEYNNAGNPTPCPIT